MRSAIPSVLIVATVMGCVGALTIEKRFEPGADVSRWRSYAWSEPPPPASDIDVRRANESIRQEVDALLTGKGYRLTGKNDADFLVNHAIYAHFETVEVSKREERAAREQGLSSDDRTQAVKPDLELLQHEQGEGSLYLFITDPGGAAVWTGSVETPLNYRGAGVKKIPTAISKLLADFPARENR